MAGIRVLTFTCRFSRALTFPRLQIACLFGLPGITFVIGVLVSTVNFIIDDSPVVFAGSTASPGGGCKPLAGVDANALPPADIPKEVPCTAHVPEPEGNTIWLGRPSYWSNRRRAAAWSTSCFFVVVLVFVTVRPIAVSPFIHDTVDVACLVNGLQSGKRETEDCWTGEVTERFL